MSTIQPTVRPNVTARAPKPAGSKPAGKPGVKPNRPKPKAPPAPQPLRSTFAERPLFQATNAIGGTLNNPKHPLEVPAGLVVAPVAIAVDVVDLFTRPLQALFTLGR